MKTRHHRIFKAYMSGPDGSDLLLLGEVEVGLSNGISILSEFAARIKIGVNGTGEPRIQLYHVWAVSPSSIIKCSCQLVASPSFLGLTTSAGLCARLKSHAEEWVAWRAEERSVTQNS
jgi:hypothetical protein